jgi:phosphatidylglycerophosphate synthase
MFIIYIICLFVFINIFQDKLKYIKYNDDIAKYIVDNVSFLKYIHPNIITLSSFALNLIIFNTFKYNTNTHLLPYILFLRWLSDILDGQIARTYNKTSKIGHILDTVSDIILAGIYLYLFSIKFNIKSTYVWIIYVIYILYCNYGFKLFETHEYVKNNEKSNIYASYLVNNSYIIFILAYIFYLQ